MKLGLRLPQGVKDLRHDIVETARAAEAAGYATLWTWERLLYPVAPKEPDRWPESYRQVAAPLPVLAAAAVVTTEVRLGTSVMIAAQHGPVGLAKTLATLDQISGGRLIAGLGAGWATDELQAAGATKADRGRFLDETLDIFDAVWGPDPVNYRGPRAIIDDAYVLPKPASKIPVMLGGGTNAMATDTPASSRAVERIAKRADGWLPFLPAPGPAGAKALRAEWDHIRDLAAEHGRDPAAMEMIVTANVTFTDRPQNDDRAAFTGTLDQIMDDIGSAAESGANEVIIDLNLQDWFRSTQQMIETALEIRQRATSAGI